MAEEKLKLYQLGTFAVGNRLVDPDERTVQARTERSNTLTSGHRAPGLRGGARRAVRPRCGDARDGRQADCRERDRLPRGLLDAVPGIVVAAPLAALPVRDAPAVATGIAAALKVKGRTDVRVVAQGGDGGTLDIGFACLSGMFERNDDVLYVCYDNEAYMNTGVQRSGATPPAARTANTKPVGDEPGNVFGQGKSAPLIAMAHGIRMSRPRPSPTSTTWSTRSSARWSSAEPATSTSSFPPLGWGSASKDTIKIARLATETGFLPGARGRARGSRERVEDPPPRSGRGVPAPAATLRAPLPRAARADVIERIQATADRNIRRFGLLEKT